VTDARRLEVGRIGRAHGLRGEVSVMLHSDRPERTATGAVLHGTDDTGATRELIVATARRHQGRWLVGFEGIADRTAAEALRGLVLHADEIPGAPDELWVHELVGSTVVDRSGTELGRVTAVEANPAHDLLVLESGALVPMPFVVDRSPGQIVVELPDGLLDL
jgi:16S rRNA processing protein RimM